MSLAYRISTITATASLNTEVDLNVLYELFDELVANTDPIVDGIIYIEYGKNRVDRGHHKKFLDRQLKHMAKETTSKRFDNQVTVVCRMSLNSMINTKIFKNGNIQMTGIRTIDQGYEVVDKISQIIKAKCGERRHIVDNLDNVMCCDYRLRLINSDFKFGFEIRREQLFKMLIDTYGMVSSFEPCIYPAVKIKYYFNDASRFKDGICYCSNKCMIGKSSGMGDRNCKKVTIAVFQSGCVIITGGQSLKQVDEAFNFITKLISDNLDIVKKKKLMVPVMINKNNDNEGIKFMIKVCNITI